MINWNGYYKITDAVLFKIKLNESQVCIVDPPNNYIKIHLKKQVLFQCHIYCIQQIKFKATPGPEFENQYHKNDFKSISDEKIDWKVNELAQIVNSLLVLKEKLYFLKLIRLKDFIS